MKALTAGTEKWGHVIRWRHSNLSQSKSSSMLSSSSWFSYAANDEFALPFVISYKHQTYKLVNRLSMTWFNGDLTFNTGQWAAKNCCKHTVCQFTKFRLVAVIVQHIAHYTPKTGIISKFSRYCHPFVTNISCFHNIAIFVASFFSYRLHFYTFPESPRVICAASMTSAWRHYYRCKCLPDAEVWRRPVRSCRI